MAFVVNREKEASWEAFRVVDIFCHAEFQTSKHVNYRTLLMHLPPSTRSAMMLEEVFACAYGYVLKDIPRQGEGLRLFLNREGQPHTCIGRRSGTRCIASFGPSV